MPIANKTYPIPPFDRLAPTTEDLDCLDLFYDSKGRAQLVERVKHALEVDDLGFHLPIEERKSNPIEVKNGGYLGYRALVNFPKYTGDYKDPPRHDIFKAHETVIADFHRKGWHQIAKPVLVLFALVMKLPENYFVERY
ncbi:hypothetical protein LQV05_006702 [Cryptococcus neoformans]|nr:hypothetical protein J007_06030 [Cryptococcus neoformans var. grubii]OXC58440.1 hypothetical protein C358_06120 [Cryptococcus neoformans var. grubii MW-RSA852]UOH83964.1 hypothetical protein LQV05_006702 [Cryptococcus neoformans]